MKRLSVRIALIGALICLVLCGVHSSNAVEIKTRPSNRTQTSGGVRLKQPSKAESQPSASAKNSTGSGRSLEDQASSDKEAEEGRSLENASELKADKKSQSASGKADSGKGKGTKSFSEKTDNNGTSRTVKSGDLSVERESEISERRLKSLSDVEREKRYPRVQGAALMTVEYLVPTKKLHNVRVLRAFTRIPRVDFVPTKQRKKAYMDAEIQLDSPFCAPRPYDVAYALEALDPQETDRVLVVETGSGYHAAVLSCLVAEVYAVGVDRNGVKRAADTCKKHGYSNVFHQVGDPVKGWGEAAPFDKIVVTRAVESIPSELVEQLKENGKIVVPVGDRYRQLVVTGEKKDGELIETTLEPTRVELLVKIPLERNLPAPSLRGGDFEELDPEPASVGSENKEPEPEPELVREEQDVPFMKRGATPEGWYDAWNFEVAERADSYSGARTCVFSNEALFRDQERRDRNDERVRAATLPEERVEKTEASETVKRIQRDNELRCQMRQSFAVDGASVKKIVFSGAYRAAILNSRYDLPTAKLASIEFFDRDRKSLGEEVMLEAPLAPCDWKEFSIEASVPAKSKEATITIGLIDGVGYIEMDALEVRDKFEKSLKER